MGIAVLCLSAGLLPALAGCGQLGLGGDDDEGARPNGVADMTAAEALAAADEAMGGLEDVTYLGTDELETRAGRRSVPLSMTILDGQRCQVFIGSNATGHLTMRIIGTSFFVRADRTAIRKVFGYTGRRAAVLRDTWVAGPAPKDVLQDCSVDELVPDGADRRSFREGPVEEVDGAEARRFDGLDDGHRISLWIATTGDPMVVRAKGRDAGGPFVFTLDRTNDGIDLAKPPPDQILGRRPVDATR